MIMEDPYLALPAIVNSYVMRFSPILPPLNPKDLDYE